MPVYLERSITSAPAGIDALPVETLCTRSSSTMTTALVKVRPVPSINFPNFMALVAATAVEEVARKNRTASTLRLRMGPPAIERLDETSAESKQCQAMNGENKPQKAQKGNKKAQEEVCAF